MSAWQSCFACASRLFYPRTNRNITLDMEIVCCINWCRIWIWNGMEYSIGIWIWIWSRKVTLDMEIVFCISWEVLCNFYTEGNSAKIRRAMAKMKSITMFREDHYIQWNIWEVKPFIMFINYGLLLWCFPQDGDRSDSHSLLLNFMCCFLPYFSERMDSNVSLLGL